MELSHLPETLQYLCHFTERLGVMHGILHRVRVRKLHIACNVVMSQIMYFWRGIYSLSQLQVGKNLMLYEGCPESIQPF